MKQKKTTQSVVRKFFTSSKLLYGTLFLFTSLILFVPLLFQEQLRTLKSLGLIGLFFINFLGSATIFFPAPAIFSVGVAGHIYNPLLVALIASVASSLGEGTGFLFGYTSKKMVQKKNERFWYLFIKKMIHKYGVLVILAFSLFPNPFLDGIGIFAGLSGYPLKKFIFWVFVGRFIRNIMIAYLGKFL